MFKKNDRVKLVRPIDKLQKIGEVFKISNIIGHIIVIVSEETGERGAISDVGIRTYFEKVEEPTDDKPLKGVSYEKIEKLMAEADINVTTFFGKTTVVAAQFPNGFVITESSSCVDPRAYDEEEGKQICLKRIKERLWEMEGYFLQEQEYLWNQAKNSTNAIIPTESKNEITDEMVESADEEILSEARKVGVFNYTPDMIEAKVKEISKRNNVDFDELSERIAKASFDKMFNMLFSVLH